MNFIKNRVAQCFNFYYAFPDVRKDGTYEKIVVDFQKILKKGIMASEDLRKDVPEEEHNEFNTYLKSLQEASEVIVEIPDIMEKTYKLINYDKFRRELEQQGYGAELKQRGEIMTKHHQNIGKKFVDKVKRNALKAGEQDARAKHDLKNEE